MKKAIQRVLSIDPIRRQSLISFNSQIIITILGFLSTLYIARIIGSDGYGAYALFISYIGIISLFTDTGITSAVVKKVSEGKDENQYYSAYISCKIVLLIAVVTALYLSRHLFVDLNESGLMPWLIAAIVIISFWGMLAAGMQATGNYGLSEISNLLNNTLRIIIQVIAVFMGFSVAGMVGGFVSGYLAGIVMLIRHIPLRLTSFSRGHVKTLLIFAFFAAGAVVGGVLLNNTDRIMLGYFFTTSEVGVYAIAFQLTMLSSLTATAIGSTIYPRFSRSAAEGNTGAIENGLKKAIPFALTLAIPMAAGGAVLRSDLLPLLYGTDFAEGAAVLVFLLIFQIFNCVNMILGNTLSATDHIRETALSTLIGAALNIALNLLLIPPMGLAGAGIATVMAGAVILAARYLCLRQHLRVNVNVPMLTHIIIASAIMGIAIAILTFAIDIGSISTLFAVVAAGAAVYLGSLYRLNAEFAGELLGIFGILRGRKSD
ncbi:MAG TPA: flippase [Methanoculleus sp.]|nr:flippase [Methanoculleus sp.]